MRRAFAPAAVLVLFAACVSADRLAPTFALVASGALAGGDGKWLRNKLDLAIKLLSRDLRIAAVNQLEESVRSLPGGDDLAALRTHLLLIIRSLSATE